MDDEHRGDIGRRTGRRDGTGEPRPNRLSMELSPNRLSMLDEPRRGAAEPAGPWEPPRPDEPEGPAAPEARGRSRSGQAAERPSRGRPNLWTLLTGAIFVLFILGRLAGDILEPTGIGATPSPGPTTPGTVEVGPGAVAFATAPGPGCMLSGEEKVFPAGIEVWWAAAFEVTLGSEDRVRWTLLRDDQVLVEETGPSDEPSDRWTGICGSAPLRLGETGTYRMEVRHAGTGESLAAGSFELR